MRLRLSYYDSANAHYTPLGTILWLRGYSVVDSIVHTCKGTRDTRSQIISRTIVGDVLAMTVKQTTVS